MSQEEDNNVVFSFNEQSDDEAEFSKKNTDNLESVVDTQIEDQHHEVLSKDVHENNEQTELNKNDFHQPEQSFNFSQIKSDGLIQDNKSLKFEQQEGEDKKSKSPVRFHKMDMDDFKRIEVKRNTRKTKTEIFVKKTFNIEKFTEDITKITEDIEMEEDKEDDDKPKIFEAPQEQNVARKNEKKKTIRFHNKKTTFQYPKELELSKDAEGLGPDVLIETMPGHDITNNEDARPIEINNEVTSQHEVINNQELTTQDELKDSTTVDDTISNEFIKSSDFLKDAITDHKINNNEEELRKDVLKETITEHNFISNEEVVKLDDLKEKSSEPEKITDEIIELDKIKETTVSLNDLIINKEDVIEDAYIKETSNEVGEAGIFQETILGQDITSKENENKEEN